MNVSFSSHWLPVNCRSFSHVVLNNQDHNIKDLTVPHQPNKGLLSQTADLFVVSRVSKSRTGGRAFGFQELLQRNPDWGRSRIRLRGPEAGVYEPLEQISGEFRKFVLNEPVRVLSETENRNSRCGREDGGHTAAPKTSEETSSGESLLASCCLCESVTVQPEVCGHVCILGKQHSHMTSMLLLAAFEKFFLAFRSRRQMRFFFDALNRAGL